MLDGSAEIKITRADIAAASGDDIGSRINIGNSQPPAPEDQIRVDRSPHEHRPEQGIQINVGETIAANTSPAPDVAGQIHISTGAESTAGLSADSAPAIIQPPLHVETETAAQTETVGRLAALRQKLENFFNSGGRKSNDSKSGPITPQSDTTPVDIRIPPINTTNRPDSTTAIPSIKVRLQEATTYAPDSSIGDGRTVNGTAVRNAVIDPGPGPGTRAARGLTPAVLRPNPRPEVTILSQPDEAPPEVKILDNPEMVAVEPTSPFRAEPAPQPIPEHLHTGGDGVLEPAAGPTLPEQPAALSHDSTEPPAIVATTGTKAAESFALVSEVDAQEGDLQLHGFQNLQTLIEQDGELDFVQIIKIINPLSDDFRTLIQDTLPGDLISEIKREKIANGPKVTYKLSSAYSADNMTVTLTRGKVEVVESYGNEKQKVSRTYKVEPDPNDQYQKRLYKDGVEVMDSREKQVLWGKFQTLNDGVILYASNMDKAFMQKFPPIQEAIPTQ